MEEGSCTSFAKDGLVPVINKQINGKNRSMVFLLFKRLKFD